MVSFLNALQPQADAAAVSAANAALDAAAVRPFSVVLSVDDETKIWLTVLALIGLAAVAAMKK